MKLSLILPLFLMTMTACGAASTDEAAEPLDTEQAHVAYSDVDEALTGSDLDRWVSVRQSLAAGFERVCADTFCRGDYTNLTSVRLACSATKSSARMHDCLWVLAGNTDFVDGRSGKISGDVRAFTCHVPVASTAKVFLDALDGAKDAALQTVVPGTNGSFYDALVKCFAGVTAPREAAQTGATYTEMGDALWAEGEAPAKAWQATQRKLARGFDDVCGDTFCEGDYSDIVALRFACAERATNARVSRCTWSFVGAAIDVGASGKLTASTMAKRCDVSVNAAESALTSALSGDSPIDAKLPGKTTSLYDAIAGCL